jgi:hypothetical protein
VPGGGDFGVTAEKIGSGPGALALRFMLTVDVRTQRPQARSEFRGAGLEPIFSAKSETQRRKRELETVML